MVLDSNARNPIRKAVQAQARFVVPIGGLNYSASTLDMPITDAYILDNFIPKASGIEVRKGWKNWVPEASAFSGEVRTILVYNDEQPQFSKLFASPSSDGKIYDITTPDTAPTPSMMPTTAADVQGEWYFSQFANEDSNYLCVVAAGAGYYTFEVDNLGVGTWTELVTGTGAGKIEFPLGDTTTAKDFCYIMTWKSRLWFFVKDSSVVYYLPIGQITGIVAPFDFGQLLELGGAMSFGATWTYDSGNGVDDSLVLVSAEGEVLVYQGTDPDVAAEFSLKGVWYIGRPPYGRRAWVDHGGDLLVVCEYGVIGMSNIIAGKLHTAAISAGVGEKINQRLAQFVSLFLTDKYWFLTLFPTEELIVLGTPIVALDTSVNNHFLMNSITNAWATMSDVDMLCADTWQGVMIAGSRDGRVIQVFAGTRDGDNYAEQGLGEDVTAKMQNAFNDFQTPNANKRALRIKLYGLLRGTRPTFYARFLAEYNLTDPITAPPPTGGKAGLWDVALWDEAAWANGESSFHRWWGVTGFGKKLSLQLAVRGSGKTLVTDYETLYETGIGL